jgi:hypothetical protein
MVRLGRERFRCTYVAIDPPVRRPNPVREVDHGEPTTICRGGVVRNDKCICPRGASVLKGVCRPTSMLWSHFLDRRKVEFPGLLTTAGW